MWRLWKVQGAWPVMGFTSHQQVHGEPSGRVVGCSHFSRQHHGGRSAPRRRHTRRRSVAPKWASGSTWFGKGSHESAGLSFYVLLGGYLAPPRQPSCLGGLSRGTYLHGDALGRHPSADPRRWRPAGGPVAGAQLIGYIHMLTSVVV
jgi:hypothetical protein